MTDPEPPPSLTAQMPSREFNVNEYVRVRVTQKGFEILRAEDKAWTERVGGRTPFTQAKRIQDEQENNAGWSKWQLWSLMSTFGPYLNLGCDPPFETTIEIPAEAR